MSCDRDKGADIVGQTVQVSSDGLRNGHMGDDVSACRAQESFPIYLLPCTMFLAALPRRHRAKLAV